MKYLYPVPKADSKRVITFANHEDYISFRLVIGRFLLTVANHYPQTSRIQEEWAQRCGIEGSWTKI